MSELLAKSIMEGGRTLSLEQHLLDAEQAALSIFKKDSRFLENWLRFFKLNLNDADRFLINLRVACLFHDVGKANVDFQKAIREHGFQQGIRHEHLSAFVLHLPEIREWLSDNKDLDLPLITSAVLCHHLKATDKNDHTYCWGSVIREHISIYLSHKQIEETLKKISILIQSKNEIPKLNYRDFSFSYPIWNSVGKKGRQEGSSFILKIKNDKQRKQFHLALKSALIISDSVASGLVRENHSIEKWIEQVIHCDSVQENEIYQKIIQPRMKSKKIEELKSFQKGIAEQGDKVLLMAGCGMGKTLAAWNWANEVSKRRKISKVIFLYPTRGTATEGFKDYASWAPEADSALMHGTAEYELESMFSNPDDPKSKNDYSIPENRERLFALAYWSKRFFSATADQFLSFLQNNYKGMCLLPVLSECALIVDEVHSFDKLMFKSLLSFLEHFDIPILCMTATLTPNNKKSLLERGLVEYPNETERTELLDLNQLEEFPRYNKTILNNSDEAFQIAIDAFQSGKRVLWVLNTVNRCQEMYERLSNKLQSKVHCYHSRFRLIDRKNVHEETVKAFQGDSRNSIAVTTQVCEMSLDLDADILISEMAPISSMVQRFGRANRHLNKGENFRAELYLYKVEGSSKPYSTKEIEQTETFLNNIPDKDISQKLLAEKLETYSNPEYKVLPHSSFTDGGYFAITTEYRDIDEYTVQAILDKDFEEVSKILDKSYKKDKSKQDGFSTVDPYILPVPCKKGLNIKTEKHSILPDYLWVVSHEYYNEQRGFINER